VADELPISYDKRELRSIITAFKAMDDEAADAAKRESSALARYAANEIKAYGITRTFGQAVVDRITSGVKVSSTSKIGELSYGFASQRFSGGGSTKDLWAGYEFGSNRYRQFPRRTPRKGRGNSGYFIYPALRKIQPELVKKWEEAFSKILKEWDK
jgi:hypothetical protein